jgi:hypothetical protein
MKSKLVIIEMNKKIEAEIQKIIENRIEIMKNKLVIIEMNKKIEAEIQKIMMIMESKVKNYKMNDEMMKMRV